MNDLTALAEALTEFGKQGTANAHRWFPDMQFDTEYQRIHLSMGLAEEAAEVLAHTKKWHRDPKRHPYNVDQANMEIVDTLLYLTQLANLNSIDWETMIAAIINKCEQRWAANPTYDDIRAENGLTS